MNLKDLPNEEKPRERLIKYGKENIWNNELIEIILKSGTRKYGLKEISLGLDIYSRSRFGSGFVKWLYGLF